MESKLTSGNILKPLATVAGDKFPIFVVMIPQEIGIREGGHLMKIDPEDLGISIKFPIEES